MSTICQHGLLPASRYVINHDIMNCTADGVVGNHLYSGRALGMSEPWDIIQLHPELKSQFPSICRHYSDIGLSHSEKVMWDIDLAHIGMCIGFEPSVFYFGPHEHRYWGDGLWVETVEYINSKNNFIKVARQLNVDVPITECFDKLSDITDIDRHGFDYPCYLKAAVSVSGVGIYRCENAEDMEKAISMFDEDVPVQVQEEVMTKSFLNMQYRVIDDHPVHLQVSEQILDGFTHQGNTVPANHEPWHIVDPLARWLVERGMRGVFAFDVAVVQSDLGLRFPVIECNPRFNGATYPTMIAHKLDIAEWRAVSLSTRYRTLLSIDLSGIQYDHKRGEGVILVNWGTVLVGKLMVLVAGDVDTQQALLLELKNRL